MSIIVLPKEELDKVLELPINKKLQDIKNGLENDRLQRQEGIKTKINNYIDRLNWFLLTAIEDYWIEGENHRRTVWLDTFKTEEEAIAASKTEKFKFFDCWDEISETEILTEYDKHDVIDLRKWVIK